MNTILVVDDEVSIRRALEKFLQSLGYKVLSAENGEEGLKLARQENIDLALVDLMMPVMGGVDFIRAFKELQPDSVAIVLTGFGSIASAVEAMRAGAYHYLTKPFELDDISSLIQTALEHRQLRQENVLLKQQVQQRYRFDNIVGTHEGMGAVFNIIEKVSDTDSTVLILGESGTGKELVARALHYNSRRRDKALVTVNCAAIPENLLEAELFGYVKGAFTGAVHNRIGRFDAANRGTLFLDEIGDMSPKLQVKLLRVLQEQRFEPIGSNRTHEVDVRVIAATHQNLEQMVREKKFREDLFYRLNVIPLHVPPLRERKSDLPVLVEHFITQYNEDSQHKVSGISDRALAALLQYEWPGNVRQLENAVERAMVFRKSGKLDLADFPASIVGTASAVNSHQVVTRAPTFTPPQLPEHGLSFKDAVADFESQLIMQALERTSGNKNRAATLLGMNRTTLVEKMKKRKIGNWMEDEAASVSAVSEGMA